MTSEATAGNSSDRGEVGEEADPEVPARARPSPQHSAKYELAILGEYEQVSKLDKGALEATSNARARSPSTR